MSPPYIPPTDTDFNSWIDNFSAVLTAAPATYGLLAADATVVAGVTATWDAAYTAAINPATRSPVTVQAKIDAKLAALATVRPYAQQIANNVGVTAPAKIAIGVNPRTTPPSPITAPVTNPILSIPSMTPLGHVLRYRDELASPTVKAKPGGVASMELRCQVSATPLTDAETIAYSGQFTKCPFVINFDSGDAGKIAYYAARWVTRTGLVGPWSPIASATVAAA
jgi:hypothetical protein